MYCPKCGRELDLGSGDVRFCRYCGFSLIDTREELQGYSKQKRAGFSIVTWAYTLLLLVALLLQGRYVSLDTRWGYWIPTLLIVLSVSFFASASLSALKPAMFERNKTKNKGEIEGHKEHHDAITAGRSLGEPGERQKVEAHMANHASITEETTRRLDD